MYVRDVVEAGDERSAGVLGRSDPIKNSPAHCTGVEKPIGQTERLIEVSHASRVAGRFKNPAVATESADALEEKFNEYKEEEDFVGCDMARKFVSISLLSVKCTQHSVGHRAVETRALGCEAHLRWLDRCRWDTRVHGGTQIIKVKLFSHFLIHCGSSGTFLGGKKYETVNGRRTEIPRLDIADQEPDKVKAAEIFDAKLKILNADKTYLRLKEKHKLEHESKELDLDGIEVVGGVPAKRGGAAKGEVGKRKTRGAKK